MAAVPLQATRQQHRASSVRLSALSLLLPLALLAALFPSGPLLLASADIHTDPEYTYTIRHYDPPNDPDTTLTNVMPSLPPISWTQSNTSLVDDGPYETVQLPAPFPFWFGSHDSVAINPNGAVHLPAPAQQGTCCDAGNILLPAEYPCSFFFTWVFGCTCCFDNSYFDLIAISLTDQHPAKLPGPTYGIFHGPSSDGKSFFVKYVHVPLYINDGTPNATAIPKSSFDLELRRDGTIVTRYTEVNDPTPYPGWTTPRVWMVGLRQGNPAPASAAALAANPASLSTRHRGEWGLTSNGTYPPRASVRSHTAITYYPFGSVACNSPSIGDGGRWAHTYVFLNDFSGHAAKHFRLVCVYNENSQPFQWPMVDAQYNSTLDAWRCDVRNRGTEPTPVVLRLNLAVKEKETQFLPITPLFFTYFARGHAILTAYEGLDRYVGEGGRDLRLCYECARMRPQLCVAPLLQPSVAAAASAAEQGAVAASLCNTPQIVSVSGGTSTVVLAPGYAWADRMARGVASKIWCVYSDPLGDASTYLRGFDPNGLNPFIHHTVSWVPARLFPNASMILCDPPPLPPGLPAGTRMNLSLAEGNFVFAGALGPVGAGYGGPEALSPLGMDGDASAKERAALHATLGNKHLLMGVTLVSPGDPELVEYQANDYVAHYLQAPGANFSASVAARAGLNLARLCRDCSARLESLRGTTATSAASPAALCLHPAALQASLCISPSRGDERGAGVAGQNASVALFTSSYPTHLRRALFDLRCVLAPFESRTFNVSSQALELQFETVLRNTTVEDCSTLPCVNVTTSMNYTTPLWQNVTRYNFSVELVPIHSAAVSIPLEYDASQQLHWCAMPALASFGLGALQAAYPNVSLSSVLVFLAENNRVLPGMTAAGAESVAARAKAAAANETDLYAAAAARNVVYTYVPATDPELVRWASGRLAVPPIPPWSACFSCDPAFAAIGSPAADPVRSLGVTSLGGSHCLQSSAAALAGVELCLSPGVGGRQEDGAHNMSVQVYASSGYPVASRAGLTRLYCVFTPPPLPGVFNSTTNQTEPAPLLAPYYSPVEAWDSAVGFGACTPPAWSFFRQDNLTLGLSEYALGIPVPSRVYRFVEETEESLVLWRELQGEMPPRDGAAGAGADARFSAQQFCTSCHATRVAVPGFTPGSPRGVAGLCYLDCDARWNGAARFDHCGACSLGKSGHQFNAGVDCMGVCGGPFLASNASDPSSGGTVQSCACEGRGECYNISAQPLVGPATTLPIPGQPQLNPLNDAAASSAQFLLRSFALPLGSSPVAEGVAAPSPSPVNDPSQSHTRDPDFNDARFQSFSPSTWLGSGDASGTSGTGFGVDPYPVAIGFAFPFFEAAHTSLYLSSSGALLFSPTASLPAGCKAFPQGTDPRVRNTALLHSLQADPSFEGGCAAANMILPCFTFLDPTANLSSPFLGAYALDGQPTNASAASIAFMRGNSTTEADAVGAPGSHRAGGFVSFKFENVPYNWAAFAPWHARFADTPLVSQARPPLYSFQITLYESGRISLKHFAVRDPAGSPGAGAEAGAGAAFNTTDLFRTLVVGMVDRPLSSSVLTQGAPTDSYMAQLRRDQNASALDLQGALAIERQRQWIPGSTVPIGVFPPRAAVVSATQRVFCPFGLNACAYPSRGPATGGTPVSLSLWNLGRDRGCVERILRLACLFGSRAAPVPASFDAATQTLRCTSPAGAAHSTVPLLLMDLAEGNGTVITSNKLFWTWLPEGDSGLLVSDYDLAALAAGSGAKGNLTRLSHIRGAGDALDATEAESVPAFELHLCESCSHLNPRFCWKDCRGDFFGDAFLDECGNCTAGRTGLRSGFARDCAGVCFGSSEVRTLPAAGPDPPVEQCACTAGAALCQDAVPPLSPSPAQTKQYVSHVSRPLATVAAAAQPSAPPPVPWTSFPAKAVTHSAPLPEYLPVDLPFLFPFHAQPLRTLHLSGWGGVLLGAMPLAQVRAQCLQGGFAALFRSNGSTTCPFHVVAASLARYDLADERSRLTYWVDERGASVSGSGSGSSCLTVVWSNMRVVGDDSYASTFAAQLCDTGLVRTSYLQVRDPHPDGRAAALAPSAPFVPSAAQQSEPAPSYASQEPFWMAGVMQSWHTAAGVVVVPPGGTDAVWPESGALRTLPRAPVAPFPYEPSASGVASIQLQRSFIPRFVGGDAKTPLGSFAPRNELSAAGSDSAWDWCPIGVDFCPSVSWGPVEGGTRVRLFGREWGCAPAAAASNGTQVCCASLLQFSCLFGGVSVPALFDPASQALECVSPGGAVLNSSVTLRLAENGRRIATRPNLFFVYNVTAAELDAALAAPASFQPSPLANLSQWYNTDAAACGSCASLLAPSLRSTLCAVDCHGDFRGSATLDSCGVCSGGRSGHVAESDRDCRGECFGPFRSVQASDAALLSAAGSDADVDALGQCVCVDDVTRPGVTSCGYYPVMDGLVQASQVVHLTHYQYFLISIAIAGVVAWQFAALAKMARGGGGAPAVPAAAAGPAPQPPPPPAGNRRAQREAAEGMMGAAGGIELQPRPRRNRAERREAEAAAAAAPAMSPAAAAAMEDSVSSAGDRPPAAHYRYGGADAPAPAAGLQGVI